MGFNQNVLGKSLIRTMATFFLRIRSCFSYKFNKISWELPEITSQKSAKTSDSGNTKILPIPTAISTKTGSFELKYKGRRTRNTQVCRHKIGTYRASFIYVKSCKTHFSKAGFRGFSEKCVFWKQVRVAGRGGLRRVFTLKNDLLKLQKCVFGQKWYFD